MMTPFADVGLPELAAAALVLGVNAYVLTGGADFGGGVWDLLARGPRRVAQRALITHSIGPIWEANHVWLILVVVVLFTAFPPAFATLGIVLHIPLSLMLVGIVLRGSSFVFRSYGSGGRTSEHRWGRVFAIASVVTPLMFGVCVGAIAIGAVGEAARLASTPATLAHAGFFTVFVDPWLAPFPLAVGAMALAMFAFLAAVYLAAAASDAALRDDFRRRAIGANVALFLAAGAALVLAFVHAPHMGHALTEGPAVVLQAAIAVAALAAMGALAARRWRLARVAAAAQASLILWGWVLVQAPMLVPPMHTVRSAAAPRATLVLLAWALGAGAVLLVPSLVYLFRTFTDVAGDRMARRR
jgi:cytochrome d ubiquinol oxidase subunit II